jgi:transcriptional regulator with XRE-family HTH domain
MKDASLIRFGINLRDARERAGLTQEGLAERTGLHRTYVGAVERGERNIGILNILRLAHSLGIGAAQLLAGCQGDGSEGG